MYEYPSVFPLHHMHPVALRLLRTISCSLLPQHSVLTNKPLTLAKCTDVIPVRTHKKTATLQHVNDSTRLLTRGDQSDHGFSSYHVLAHASPSRILTTLTGHGYHVLYLLSFK